MSERKPIDPPRPDTGGGLTPEALAELSLGGGDPAARDALAARLAASPADLAAWRVLDAIAADTRALATALAPAAVVPIASRRRVTARISYALAASVALVAVGLALRAPGPETPADADVVVADEPALDLEGDRIMAGSWEGEAVAAQADRAGDDAIFTSAFDS